jgi:GTP cyclohydrolase I
MKQQEIEKIIKDLLIAIGEDPTRDGLIDTPKRVAKYWIEFMEYDAGKIDTAFESVKTDQMVVVKDMKVWTLCEHHLLPFWTEISIGYITRDKVLGLSKFARIAHKHAHKLQLQEKLVDDIANEIKEIVNTEDVAVYGKGQHLCMVSRGIRTDGIMVTSNLSGVFRNESETRQEFYNLVK